MVNTITTATNPDYMYKFYYRYKDNEVSMSFNADVDMYHLCMNIQNFLKACSWREDTVEEYIKTEDD